MIEIESSLGWIFDFKSKSWSPDYEPSLFLPYDGDNTDTNQQNTPFILILFPSWDAPPPGSSQSITAIKFSIL